MAKLTVNTALRYTGGDIIKLGIEALEAIFQGAALSEDGSGFVEDLQAGDQFMGFALEAATGGAADGDVLVHVQHQGIIELTVVSAAITDIGADVYASDDNTFVLGSTGNTKIGVIIGFTDVANNLAWVKFNVGLL